VFLLHIDAYRLLLLQMNRTVDGSVIGGETFCVDFIVRYRCREKLAVSVRS
jgi:hypothetical protein